MPEAIFKFNLPEERDEFNIFNQALDMNVALFEIEQLLREKIKYAPDDINPQALEAYEEIQARFYEIIENNNVSL